MNTILRRFDPFSREAMPYRSTLAWGSILLLGALVGCASRQEGDRLRRELFRFADYFDRTLERTAIEVQEKEDQRGVDTRHSDIVEFWRSQFVEECNTAINRENPQQGLLYVWILSRRVQNFLETDESTRFLGESRPVVLKAARRVEERAEGIAAAYLKEKTFRDMRKEVTDIAIKYPVQSTILDELSFDQPSYSTTQQGQDVLEMLLGWAMKPMRDIGELLQTPFSTDGFCPGLERATDVLEDFPKEARGQLEGVADDLEMRAFEITDRFASKMSEEAGEELRKVADDLEKRAFEITDRFTSKMSKEAREDFAIVADDLEKKAFEITDRFTSKMSEAAREQLGIVADDLEKKAFAITDRLTSKMSEAARERLGSVADDLEKKARAITGEFTSKMRNVVTYAGKWGLGLMAALSVLVLLCRAITTWLRIGRSAA